MTDLTRPEMTRFFRPNFFANTPDILPPILQAGGRAAFKMRLTLAATLSPTYGIYSGFELCESSRSRAARSIFTPRNTRSKFGTGMRRGTSTTSSRA